MKTTGDREKLHNDYQKGQEKGYNDYQKEKEKGHNDYQTEFVNDIDDIYQNYQNESNGTASNDTGSKFHLIENSNKAKMKISGCSSDIHGSVGFVIDNSA